MAGITHSYKKLSKNNCGGAKRWNRPFKRAQIKGKIKPFP